MKTNKSLEREIQAVTNQINHGRGDDYIGHRGSKKYEVAFAILETLRWARGYREKHPSVKISTYKERQP